MGQIPALDHPGGSGCGFSDRITQSEVDGNVSGLANQTPDVTRGGSGWGLRAAAVDAAIAEHAVATAAANVSRRRRLIAGIVILSSR